MGLFRKKGSRSEIEKKWNKALDLFDAARNEKDYFLAFAKYLKSGKAFFEVKNLALKSKNRNYLMLADAFLQLGGYESYEDLCLGLSEAKRMFQDEKVNSKTKLKVFKILKDICEVIEIKMLEKSFDQISEKRWEYLNDKFDEKAIEAGHYAESAMDALLKEVDHEFIKEMDKGFRKTLLYREKRYNVRKGNIEEANRLAKALKDLIFPELVRDLEDKNIRVRIMTIQYLKEIGDSESAELVTRALKDENELVRISATSVLEEIGDERAVEPLIHALKDENDFIRIRAASALGKIKDERAVEPLIEAFEDKDKGTQIFMANALGDIGEPAVESLLQALRNGNSSIRSGAALAIGKTKDTRAIRPLIQALKDKDGNVRLYASGGLREIGVPAVEPLLQALEDEDSDFQGEVRTALGSLAMGSIGNEPVLRLLSASRDMDSNILNAVAIIFGRIALGEKEENDIEPIIQGLESNDRDIREKTIANLLEMTAIKHT